MRCQSCGTILQPGAVACPSCDTPVSSDTSEFSSYEYISSNDTVPYIPYVQPIEATSMSPGQQSQPDLQSQTNPQAYTDPEFYISGQSSPERDVQQFPGVVQQPTPMQRPRRAFSAATIVLFVILALLIGAGGMFSYFMIVNRSAQNQTQAAAGAPAISTTVIPTSAQNTTAVTTTDPQVLYTQATSGTPAFEGSLNSQNPDGWVAVGGTGGSCAFTGNALHASALPPQDSFCVAPSVSFGNFAYQARITITQGDTGGLIFRFDILDRKAYLFAISPSQGFYLLVSGQGNSLSQGNARILAGATSSAINTGLNQPNLLTVIARGSTIYLYVNQQYITSVSDSISSAGVIGVFGENSQNGSVDVTFSNIQVWKL